MYVWKVGRDWSLLKHVLCKHVSMLPYVSTFPIYCLRRISCTLFLLHDFSPLECSCVTNGKVVQRASHRNEKELQKGRCADPIPVHFSAAGTREHCSGLGPEGAREMMVRRTIVLFWRSFGFAAHVYGGALEACSHVAPSHTPCCTSTEHSSELGIRGVCTAVSIWMPHPLRLHGGWLYMDANQHMYSGKRSLSPHMHAFCMLYTYTAIPNECLYGSYRLQPSKSCFFTISIYNLFPRALPATITAVFRP